VRALGIDAAWTVREPSGVALITDDGSGWRLLEVAASYAEFLRDRSALPQILRHRGSIPDAGALISTAAAMAGAPIDLVAIDMPLATVPIAGRRTSDNLISAVYGARHASTHTPSSARPGKISDELREGFEDVGYPLTTTEIRGRHLIEDRGVPTSGIDRARCSQTTANGLLVKQMFLETTAEPYVSVRS